MLYTCFAYAANTLQDKETGKKRINAFRDKNQGEKRTYFDGGDFLLFYRVDLGHTDGLVDPAWCRIR